jgi:hypothetical protein
MKKSGFLEDHMGSFLIASMKETTPGSAGGTPGRTGAGVASRCDQPGGEP